ncbi:phospholipase D family protein [Alteriqipengyuania sp. 357]
MKRLHALAGMAAILVAGLALRKASGLPERRACDGEPMPDASDTWLARAVRQQTQENPGLSGVHFLEDGIDAFAARLLLIRNAERRIDVQYYVWHGDRTGTLMLEAIRQAAERGVQVRMLLDDNGISGLDPVLSALGRHPNIEIRLFNPFPIRFPKALGFLVDFQRLNRRMHNKSLTVDACATIVGGRNIGDEYFGAGDKARFADLDVFAVGPVVGDVTKDFQRYWDSESAYPAQQILAKVGAAHQRRLASRAAKVEQDAATRRYMERVEKLPLVSKLSANALELVWAEVRLLSDDPAKGLGKVAQQDLMLANLERTMGPVTSEIGLVSPYFVPGEEGAEYFAGLAESGVSVTVLTNGYAANNIRLVHAGYVPFRKRLVASGVRLFEIQPWSESGDLPEKPKTKGTRIGVASRFRGTGTGSTAGLRAGATTLHAKTFTVDRKRVFVGSFNFDPRSFALNTELGFVIESAELASWAADTLADQETRSVCEVVIGADGDLQWKAKRHGTSVRLDSEPGMGVFDRLFVAVASRLPLSRLL